MSPQGHPKGEYRSAQHEGTPMNANPDAILEVKGLTKLHGSGCDRCLESTGPEAGTNVCPHCGTVVACADVNLSLMRGEVLGVMGESGSGKSSLVRLLYGDDAPTRGSVRFRDPAEPDTAIDLLALNAQQARRLRNRRFGIVYQTPHLGLNFTVSAGGIEVAEDHAGQSISTAEIAQQMLHHPLAAAIRIDRILAVCLCDWQFIRHAVSGTSGGKNKNLATFQVRGIP